MNILELEYVRFLRSKPIGGRNSLSLSREQDGEVVYSVDLGGVLYGETYVPREQIDFFRVRKAVAKPVEEAPKPQNALKETPESPSVKAKDAQRQAQGSRRTPKKKRAKKSVQR